MGRIHCQTFAIMMFFMLLFPGCLSEDNSDLEQRIENLEKQIEEQEQIIHNHSLDNQISSTLTVNIFPVFSTTDQAPPCDENGCYLRLTMVQEISGGEAPYETKWYLDGEEDSSDLGSPLEFTDPMFSFWFWSHYPILSTIIQANTNENHNFTAIVIDSNNHSASSSYLFTPTVRHVHSIGDFMLRVEGAPEGETVQVSATFTSVGDFEGETEGCEFYVVSNGSDLWEDNLWQEHRCELGTFENPIQWNMTVCVSMRDALVDVDPRLNDEATCVHLNDAPHLPEWEQGDNSRLYSFSGFESSSVSPTVLGDGDNKTLNGLLRFYFSTEVIYPDGHLMAH